MPMLFPYLVLINAAGLLLMLEDKRRARKNLWRIPERTLLGIAVLGGSIGCLLGMYTIRHKTLHLKFSAGIPLILVIQLALAAMILLAQ